jgi:hypothetical protein
MGEKSGVELVARFPFRVEAAAEALGSGGLFHLPPPPLDDP